MDLSYSELIYTDVIHKVSFVSTTLTIYWGISIIVIHKSPLMAILDSVWLLTKLSIALSIRTLCYTPMIEALRSWFGISTTDFNISITTYKTAKLKTYPSKTPPTIRPHPTTLLTFFNRVIM